MMWSLAAQLRLGLVAGVLMVIGVFGAAWWIALDYREQINVIYKGNLRDAIALAEANSALWNLRYMIPHFAVGSAEERQRILVDQEKQFAIIEERLAAFAEGTHSTEESRVLISLQSAYQRYKQAWPKFFELWAAGEKDQAIAWRSLATIPYGEEAGRALATQIALQQSFQEIEEAKAEQGVRVSLALVAAITIALLAMLVIGYAYSVRLLRPIRALRARMQGIEREQLGETMGAAASANEVAALVESFDLMSERLRVHTESLRASETRLKDAQRMAHLGHLQLDAASGRMIWSDEMYAIFGRDPASFRPDLQTYCAELVHPDDRAALQAAEQAAYRDGGMHRLDHRILRPDGSVRWVQAEGRAETDAAGRPLRIIATVQDITERHEAKAAVVEALRAKTEFMNNVTHELRTPLNSVIGFAELLADEVAGPLNAKQAAFAADILASGQRLLALVEGILEMSRLDAAGVALTREPVQIGAALEERVAAHGKAAAAHGVTMRLDVAPEAGSAESDPKALRRILDALLDNAIKFNREGGAVAVSARRVDGAIEIAVADTGIGIAREDLAKLFKPLVQLDAGLARRHGGVGIGLALARRLAELHGGAIEVESEPGKGSSFTLRLPVQEKKQ
jgi:PAS domain S-box-containing protein